MCKSAIELDISALHPPPDADKHETPWKLKSADQPATVLQHMQELSPES